MEKIFKILLWSAFIEIIATGLIVLYFAKVGLAQTIGIGVSPSVVKFNSPGTYVYEFCFFNQGDTDAVYETVNGEVIVQYQKFTVPARTNFTNCVKKQLLLTVIQPGYFYITAKPATQEQQAGAVSVVRRVGVKIELANYTSQTNVTTGNQTNQTTTTTTTITSGGGGGTASQQTTTTITSGGGAVGNQTNATKTTTTTLKNQTNQTITTTKKVNSPPIDESVVEKQVIEALNKTTNLTNKPSFGIIDIAKIALMIGVIVGLIYLIFYVIQVI
jgi:hypothetical protein